MGKTIYKEFSFWVVGHIDGAEPQIGEGLKTCFSTGICAMAQILSLLKGAKASESSLG